MDRGHPLDRLDFNDEALVDDNVGPKAFSKSLAVIFNQDRLLPLNWQSNPKEAICENRLVNGFQKARPKLLVDLETAIHGNPCQFFNVVHSASFAPSREP